MLGKKKRKNLEDEISFFVTGLSHLADTPIGLKHSPKFMDNPFKHLKKMIKRDIRQYGLVFASSPQKAKYMVIMYADFDNSDGYDCVGYNCFKKSFWGKFPEVNSIRYCGVCGDVNDIRLTRDNSKIIYLSAA